ncbi:hypothetical protein BJV85_002791 [Clostridium acetobutylicum]|uniref:Uncharacterized protein n=1 Tax=Clostridium acetobutylicum (strain ATCC 824 / DSM 792 / JCM 1419 / IAM 19013 / LMG 5710 / NBRC 13948 / NRRL B-527 / VKM B-1787 / 2291 / W) TaxID=272562 RepID=Q97JR6_CLOAB|nr:MULTISPECIES: hypothetical protein [Clostridium]AAK79179.1 Hypothetical protein CA_C1207 [Clostridium acetobutylicum ATCC 824]ADZ20257.1 Conserved hypothetical protein [Clostridium acetobutylicum EA 2018]AEI31711.1 hypothetical protein SMB_G1227 [Clostridium acetobutylicum DSM 1731]AWV81570.1 hypothetical protein DK921_16015 [Clostridium acetobutylicum]MBC2393210.1 hypothetical protein [Clostridium acetobutylicum]
MKKTRKQELDKCFIKAKNQAYSYVAVVIKIEGFPVPEIIVNYQENFDKKQEYYDKTYDDNLNHKFAKGIKIVAISVANDLSEFKDLFKPNKNKKIK